MNFNGLIFAIIVIALFIHDAIKTKNRRAKIKERAHAEYNAENLSSEYYQERLIESESMYEDLEEAYYVHIATLIGLATHLYWEVWYISLAVGALVTFLGLKFLTTKPFSQGTPDNDA